MPAQAVGADQRWLANFRVPIASLMCEAIFEAPPNGNLAAAYKSHDCGKQELLPARR